jgi:hypothetical protein
MKNCSLAETAQKASEQREKAFIPSKPDLISFWKWLWLTAIVLSAVLSGAPSAVSSLIS